MSKKRIKDIQELSKDIEPVLNLLGLTRLDFEKWVVEMMTKKVITDLQYPIQERVK